MAALEEYASALRMRDLVQTLVRAELDRVAPPYTYGTVTSIDRNARRCQVQFAGEPVPVSVAMGSIQPKEVGQIVRIDGKQGDRFIDDVMGPSLTLAGATIGDNRPSAPYFGEIIHETTYNRTLIWDGSNWRLLGDTVQLDEIVAITGGAGSSVVLGTSTSWTPDYIGVAKLRYWIVMDISAAGRAGFAKIQRRIAGGTWDTIHSTRYHDSGDGTNIDIAQSWDDVGWVPGQSIEYRLWMDNDQATANGVRAESHFYIQWKGRA